MGTRDRAHRRTSVSDVVRPLVHVAGLGPGPDELLSIATIRLIERIPHRFLRTARHPNAHVAGTAESFDRLYETLPDFDAVYTAIAEELVAASTTHGEVLYLVPGSPLVLEASVARLVGDERVRCVVHPAIGFLDLAWSRLGLDPVEAGVRLIDGHRFATEAAGERGPLLVAQVHDRWVASEIKLAHEHAEGDEPVVVLHHLGLPDERVFDVPWAEIDRAVEYDHLTALYVPRLATPIAGSFARLHELARTLRERCPWDREQTHGSLVTHLIEETYEVVDALIALDPDDPATDEALIEELGDLLYQVEFHATIAEEEGRFTLAEVADRLHDKLVRRHPHVFGGTLATSASDVESTWDSIKRGERGDGSSMFDGVAAASPALTYATKVQSRAAKVGFDWPDAIGPADKIAEEARELASASSPDDLMAELGDVLFSVVNLARHLGVDAEAALRGSAQRFRGRVETMETLARTRGLELRGLTLAQLDALWDEAKGA